VGAFVSATAARFADKRVNAQEFGLPDHELGEDRLARYASAVLQRLWWLAPHELHFGLEATEEA
jgi:hypothetical protein